LRRTLRPCLRRGVFFAFPPQISLSSGAVQTCSRTRLSFPTEVMVFDTPPHIRFKPLFISSIGSLPFRGIIRIPSPHCYYRE
jgi:hypothetical protein